MRRDLASLTLIEVLVVIVLTAMVATLVGFLFVQAQRRKNVARTRANMRSLALACESYLVDNSIYPAWGIGQPGPGKVRTFNWDVAQETGNRSGVAGLPTFLLCDPTTSAGRFGTLTTLADLYVDKSGAVVRSTKTYLETYPLDRFCADRGATFVYWAPYPGLPEMKLLSPRAPVGGLGFILVSPGPDGRYDLPGSYEVYNPAIAQPSVQLLAGTSTSGSAFTYDPTNGLISDGDICRVKQ